MARPSRIKGILMPDMTLTSPHGFLKWKNTRDEDPEFFSTDPDPDPDPAQLKKNSDSGSDLKSKWRKKYIYILGR